MIEPIEEMPEGSVGLRASGEVTADDYEEVLEPALRAAVEAGEIRFLYLIEGGFKMDPGAMLQDAKTGFGIGLSHVSAWRRTAIVTDIDWVKKAMHMFAWMMPGDFEVFPASQLETAKSWVGE